MIVTCASCLTKFSLDESRIPEQGAKVRCSRCQHVFHIVPPLATEEEEIVEDFESFAKSHEDVIEPGLKTMVPPPTKPKEREKVPPAREERIPPEAERRPELEDSFPVSEEALQLLPRSRRKSPLFLQKRVRQNPSRGSMREGFGKRRIRRKRKSSSGEGRLAGRNGGLPFSSLFSLC